MVEGTFTVKNDNAPVKVKKFTVSVEDIRDQSRQGAFALVIHEDETAMRIDKVGFKTLYFERCFAHCFCLAMCHRPRVLTAQP